MNIKIDLANNRGFSWYIKDRTSVKGYVFDENGDLLTNSTLASYFYYDNKTDFESRLMRANGSFCFVIDSEESIILGVDRLRSIPIFYYSNGTDFKVLDSPSLQIDEFEKKDLDLISVDEFFLSGYTSNDNTLLSELHQLQAGEYIIYNKQSAALTSKFYYKHLHNYTELVNDDSVFQKLDKISESVFKRLIASCDGRTIVLPLSGGYDSRYIAAMLRKLDYKNVICYTYGKRDSFEVKVSEKVAEKLGYKWYFIEYDKKRWERVLDFEFYKYIQYSHNYSSLPHIQEFLAISFLKEQHLIPENGIVVPGFCGDLLGGSFLISDLESEKISLNKIALIEYIYFKHFNLIEDKKSFIKNEKQVNERITEFFKEGKIETFDDFVSNNEHWFTLNKVSKFVINSNRVYEFFNYSWRLPLWDNELAEFWYGVPNHYREGSTLYQQYLFRVFDIYDISYRKPFYYKNSLLKRLYKRVFGQLSVVNYLLYDRADVNSFKELYKILEKTVFEGKIESKYKNTHINHILTKWVFEKFIMKK